MPDCAGGMMDVKVMNTDGVRLFHVPNAKRAGESIVGGWCITNEDGSQLCVPATCILEFSGLEEDGNAEA